MAASAHTPAPLGPRVLAWVVDHALVVIVAMVATIVLLRVDGGLSAASFVVLVVCLLVGVGWGVYLWWSGGERGATPGLRLMGLRIVSMRDGDPVGWGRFLARLVTVSVLAATIVGWPLMLIWLVADRNRRGWHDLAAGAIVTPQPRRSASQFSGVPAPTTTSVPLPAHLRAWAPQADAGPERRHESPVIPEPYREAPRQEHRPAVPTYQHRPESVTHQQPGTPSSAGGYQHAEPTGPAPATMTGPGFERAPGTGTASAPSGGPGVTSGGDAAWAPVHDGPPMVADATAPPPTPPAAPPGAPDDDPDRTSLRPQQPEQTFVRDRQPQRATPPPPKWQLVLGDGREVPLDRAAVLGRRPAQPPGKPVHLVTVDDTTRTLSKSHIRVDADEDSPFVTDLGSTNGSALVTSTGHVTLHAHQPRRIPEGQVVRFGEHEFTIRRSTPR